MQPINELASVNAAEGTNQRATDGPDVNANLMRTSICKVPHTRTTHQIKYIKAVAGGRRSA